MNTHRRMCLRTNEAGFIVVELVIVLVVLAGIAGAGVYVWNTRNSKVDTDAATTSIQADDNVATYVVPAGYISYKDTAGGYRLAYPAVFGNFGAEQKPDKTSYRQTASSTEYGSGVSGNFTLFVYDTAQAAIGSRKYGPQIQLKNGKWLVTQTNDADVSHNKVGDEYKDLDGNTLTAHVNRGLAVYTFVSKDEDAQTDALVFAVKDKTYALLLPTFDTTSADSDTAAYNKLIVNVRSSIRTAD